MVDQGVKVIFKPKKLAKMKKQKDSEGKEISVIDEVQTNGTDFSSILNSIILDQKDPYLLKAYDLIVHGKHTDLENVMFL